MILENEGAKKDEEDSKNRRLLGHKLIHAGTIAFHGDLIDRISDQYGEILKYEARYRVGWTRFELGLN